MLHGVARTFSLTIAQLPIALRALVGNAYLLCRIADTIEDEPALSLAQKDAFSKRWVKVVGGRTAADSFARELGAHLSASTTDAERRLVAETARVVRINREFSDRQRRSLERCVRIMAHGMVEFQRKATSDGLKAMSDVDRYCYHVAGVVGETLTELFCDYSAEIENHREELLQLSVSFGQGLQMVNILKDIWEDRRRGACWLPRDVFKNAGLVELSTLSPGHAPPGFVVGLTDLVAITRRHLASGLRYVLLIPARETGIRRCCLLPLGLALLTLRRIHATPAFVSGQEVKVPRNHVWAVASVSSALASSNSALALLFDTLSRGLPEDSSRFNDCGCSRRPRTQDRPATGPIAEELSDRR